MEQPLVQAAAVAVSGTAFSFDRLFDYLVPAYLEQSAQPGCRVLVPFGRGNRKRIGMILVRHEIPADPKLKPLLAVPDPEPVLNGEMLELSDWLHEQTFCTYYDAVRCLLPSGMNLRVEEHFSLSDQVPDVPLTEEEAHLLRFLRMAKSRRELDAMLDVSVNPDKQELIHSLLQKGCIQQTDRLAQAVGDKYIQMIRLSDAYLTGQNRHQPTPKQRQVLALLEENGPVAVREACYLCGVTPAVVKTLLKHGLVEQYDMEQLRPVQSEPERRRDPSQIRLSDQQQKVYDTVAAQIHSRIPKVFLLHGVTGSGKTSVFEALIAHTLSLGRQAMLLIPEIALTPQIVSRFQQLFGDGVAVIHSNLSLGQRMDEYKRIRRGEARIVIGTRSAVFAPLSDMGLIILDEEGERSYKSDNAPRYHAADVAKHRCRTHGASVLLASATPSLESYYYAQRGLYQLLEMPERYGNAVLPTVDIVDMNQERAQGNGSEFSNLLTQQLQQNLAAGEQSLLLLNRRGYHTIIACCDCNTPVECPNCSVPLTYHRANDSLMCHYCGYCAPPVQECPNCKSTHLKQMGFGTQKLEEALGEIVPGARILRMDADTTFSRMAYEEKFRAFGRGEYDIMVGTQMIGKGLDFPNVTLVGVLSIDKALFAGDFRSYERTFSLITQVVGRGGRGGKQGRAILQSFLPDHYVLNLAAKQDYGAFYREEIALRKALMFPPICDICVIGLSSELEKQVQLAADTMLRMMRDKIAAEHISMPLRVLGPVRCTYGKLNGKYRYRIILKCKNNAAFRQFIRQLLCSTGSYKEFARVRVFADMNGDIGV